MINETSASVRGAPCDSRVRQRARGGVRKWMRLAPLLLAVLWAVAATLAGASAALAQDSVESDVLSYIESQFGGYGLRQASAVVVSPDDTDVYVASEQDDAVVHFARDAATGDLTYVATYVNGENNVTGLNDPVDLAMSADGANLYAVGKQDDAVVVFTRDATDGDLTWLETEVNGEGGVEKLDDPDAVSVSPDGANVYVAGDTALTVFARAAADGALEFVEAEEGNGGAGGSFQLRDVIVSPDNSNVYVTSYLQNAVAVLDRDTGDMGKVSVTQVLSDGVAGVTGLSLAEKLSISPDGANVYATGALSTTQPLSGTVVVFNRSGGGTLSHVETLVNSIGGVDGLSGARSVETSADGQNVYVAGTSGSSLAVFNRGGGGSLTFAACFTANAGGSSCQPDTDGLVNPSGLAISTDGASMYATGKESDSLVQFDRDTGSGALTYANTLYNSDGGVPGLGGADDAAVSPDGKHVYVTGERDNSVVVFERGAMGSLQFVEKQTEGEAGVNGLVEPSSVTVSPDGNHVYATGYDEGTVVVFARDTASGTLNYVETKTQGESGVTGLKNAWSAALSPDGENLYATGSGDNAIAAFSRDASTGALTYIQLQKEGESGVTGLVGASGIVVSPDGLHVYVAGSGSDAVAAFRRDGPNGELTFIQAYGGPFGLDGVIDVAVSADGKNVYAASVVDGTVTVFQRDAATGQLAYVDAFMRAETEDAPAEAAGADALSTLYWSVAVSPDGKYVFAVSWDVTTSIVDPVGRIDVFARNAESGLLSKTQSLRNDEGGVRGLRTPTSVTVSADGANVYATSGRDSATLVFEVTGSAEYSDTQFLPYMYKD